LGNDPVHSPFADTEVTLPEFLRNDLGACLRVKESMADDLANDFLSAPVFVLGTSLGAEEALGAIFAELG
jgi:hypothetical protein